MYFGFVCHKAGEKCLAPLAFPRVGPSPRAGGEYNTSMLLRLLLAFVVCTGALSAEVVRIEIQSRGEVLGGRAFGLAGPYEKLVGTVHFAVDAANHQPDHR